MSCSSAPTGSWPRPPDPPNSAKSPRNTSVTGSPKPNRGYCRCSVPTSGSMPQTDAALKAAGPWRAVPDTVPDAVPELEGESPPSVLSTAPMSGSAGFTPVSPELARPTLFARRKHWAERFGIAPVLPTSRAEMDALGWEACDVILVTGDAYVDHPSFGMALVGRLLEAHGFRVG